MAQVRNGPAVRASGPFAFLLVLLASVSSPAAQAWGNQGHRITALFADTLLTPRTRAGVRELTGALSLAELATWADDNRSGLTELIDKSDQWHFDNRPVCAAAAPLASYCPDGQCASAALKSLEATLSDRHASADQRGIALRFLVHVLGDIHQPLHAGENGDAGGNKLNAGVSGSPPRNLHSWWDTGLLQQMLRDNSEQPYANGLREWYQGDIEDWQRGSEQDWMSESYEIAREHTYGRLPGFRCGAAPPFVTPLDEAYIGEAKAQIARQLARAGTRIALTLNRILDPR